MLTVETMDQEFKDRLTKRLQEMKDATTPEGLAYTIWTKQLEEAMGSSRNPYRQPFVNWISSYAKHTPETPNEWSDYKTPEELAEGIWPSKYDINESDKVWFGALRSGLVEWINQYISRYWNDLRKALHDYEVKTMGIEGITN